nr:hypothetical protein GCM10020185_75390 [Pseudomonas brassicacearum subsp. brassicacearum]
MNTAQRSIQQYISAKDGNRPHLLDQAFTPTAILHMVVRTGSITFPDHVEGRTAIGDVLVSRFGQTFEKRLHVLPGRPATGQRRGVPVQMAGGDVRQEQWRGTRRLWPV